MTIPNHDQLIERLLADELSAEQQQHLAEIVTDDASVENEVFDQMWLEPLLRDSFKADADAFVQRIEAAMNGRGDDTSRFTDRVVEAWTQRLAWRSKRRILGILAGTTLTAAILAVLLFYPMGSGSTVQAAAPIVRLQNASGTVKIIGADGRPRRVAPGIQIERGDTLTTSGEGSATVSWDDGSHVILTRDTSLTWPVDKPDVVILNAGLAVVARSTPDDAAPVVFETQHAKIEVPDTRFLLATSDRQTDVTVTRGKARLTGADGKSVEVADGECVVAKPRSVEHRKGSATPDTWSEDFESGLPGNWKQGRFVNTKLPKGSLGAVQTALSRNEQKEPCHQIWTYGQWQHGLAVVHKDTCLNFVYCFKTADRVQILTLLRPPIPDSPAYEVQMLQPGDVPAREQWWRVPSFKWYQVSIPLSRLCNPVSREHPTESYIATAFNFRPQDHACGLVIDRMWLARGTSKKIEFKPLPVDKK